ncbi:beta-mannosidase [Gracilinema caldarium]|uniref:Beta-mannosidase n=1 Tax=Gracilinema caldarium (strain ATCC 51460 / DSM 7334 / H1) TaxID=744872 RepID=F8EWY8_GRAC1|nr:glycoside hydrolase family 2 protein [Gracilinema caldarium]AEJ18515.1 Beta-mannosidase [Gracilinema caldarium DSM 7334]
MSQIDLSGMWTLRLDSSVLGKVSVPCSIPGDCHSALLAANLIPDPYYGQNELEVQFLNQEDFILERNIELSPEQLQQGSPYLYFESIDTVTEVLVNGKPVTQTNNMFHAHVIDLGCTLQSGTNTIRIHFHAAEKAAAQRAQQLPYPIPHSVYPVQSLHRNQIRKVQCHSGWDWGPCLMVSGLYGACYIDFASPGRIDNLSIRTIPAADNTWDIPVTLRYTIPGPGTTQGSETTGASGPKTASFSITMNLRLKDGEGKTVLKQTTEHRLHGPGNHQLEAILSIKNPKLWWPSGYGEQHLYTLEAAVWSSEKSGTESMTGQGDTVQETVQKTASPGTAIQQRATKRIGFRDLKVITEDDEIGRSMTFQVNGKAIWAKGANWIPLDSLPSRQTTDRYRNLLHSMVQANMNMVRVWGGGQYERDVFYDLCDELGILVWQDMMFSCSTYPADPEFLETVRREIRFQVLRLKEHPSIALWCGNNENVGALTWYPETRANRDRYIIDYDRLNEGIVGKTIRELDPDRTWWPSSPSAGPNDFSDNWHSDGRGDMHYWSVWHEGKPFEAYYDVTPRFCSEFGYQSFPSEETVASYCPEDQRNLTSPVMEHHQKNPRGNSIIIENFSRYFRFPEGFANMLYLSQVQQALAIQTAVEYWRSRRPICMGALYWQLNDCWPVASWSSIEYSGKWKLLHYAARRFFAPIALVSFVKDQSLQVHLINDTDRSISGTVTLAFINFAGKTVQENTLPIHKAGEGSHKVWELDLKRLPFPVNSAFFRGLLHIDEGPSASCVRPPQEPDKSLETVCFLVPPKQCNLEPAHIRSRLSVVKNYQGEAELLLQLNTDRPAFFVSVDIPGMKGHWEDNLFTLLPGTTRAIRFMSEASGTEEGGSLPSMEYVQAHLRIQHLRESYH